jgi:hypothetical protein
LRSPVRRPAGGQRRAQDRVDEVEPPRRRNAPPMPSGVEWPPDVVAWWRAVWVHPIASEWDPVADLQTARRLGDLFALLASGGEVKAALLTQVTRLETELLLTPASRKCARVRFAPEARRERGQRTGRGALAVVPSVDPREMLR